MHRYKNLLNAMAALFYTNHRMKDVTSFFGQWRQLALELQQQDEEVAKKQKYQHSIESPGGAAVGGVNMKPGNEDEFISESIIKNPEARFSIDPDDKGMAWAD